MESLYAVADVFISRGFVLRRVHHLLVLGFLPRDLRVREGVTEMVSGCGRMKGRLAHELVG